MPPRTIMAMAVSGLALLMLAAPARADCVDDCQASTYCDSAMMESGECNDKLDQCYQLECNKPSESFGAIAYGAGSQAYGFSYDSPNEDAASNIALNNCKKHGDDCKVVLHLSNSCGAVAAVSNSNSYATGQGATKEQAQFFAVANCKKNGGGGACEVQVWSCALP